MELLNKVFLHSRRMGSREILERSALGNGSFILYLYLLHLYPGFYSYAEGATWKILDLLTETLLINPQSRFPGHSAESTEEGCIGKCP